MRYVNRIFLQVLFCFLHNGFVSCQDPDCDYYQNVEVGQSYYVYSKNYPDFYGPSTTCRWQAQCPANTRCQVSCTLEIPSTDACEGDRFLVSKTGDSSLTGAERYCGTGTLDAISLSNGISLALISTANSPGGKLICSLGAVDGGGASTPCECGWQKQTRIVGGEETEVNEFPLMAGLVDYVRRIVTCGATIISTRWVVTAAHCLDNVEVVDIGILVGDHNVMTGTDTDTAELIPSERFIQHQQYSTDQYEYDIGLVRTTRDITFSDEVGPACLPFLQASFSFDGDVVQVLGWGTTSFGGPQSDYLQKVSLNVVNQDSCRSILGSIINERKLCTFSSGKDACQFDSGGPLVWQSNTNGRYYLVGIVSIGSGCATSRPAPNTRVSEYLDWIRENTPDAQYCSA